MTGWGPAEGQNPLPPTNFMALGGPQAGVIDLRWDDPSLLAGNTPFEVVGVNVYRSVGSDRGPFLRLNQQPLGACFHRDRTDVVAISELVLDDQWLERGDGPNVRRWRFRTRELPIVKAVAEGPLGRPVNANAPTDVSVWIDGVPAEIHEVFGPTGEVVLVGARHFDQATGRSLPPILPSPASPVEVRYHVARNVVPTGLDVKVWYRATTVVLDPDSPYGLRETPLQQSRPASPVEVEQLDWIWREAVRRNQWILQRGGERVHAFLRKLSGVRCDCGMDPRVREQGKQPSNRCRRCFGTGIVGGYEGPYEIVIAPDDAERRISQGPYGRRMEHQYEVWIGPSPLVTQRDFIVKQTAERYSIGPVRRPSHQGNVLQQHFTIAFLDPGDARYAVPIDGTGSMPVPRPETRYAPMTYAAAPARPVDGAVEGAVGGDGHDPFPVGPDAPAAPMVTNDQSAPVERQRRGRTPTWEIEH